METSNDVRRKYAETLLDAAAVLLVEHEHGGFASVQPERVTALDSGKLFDSYYREVGNE